MLIIVIKIIFLKIWDKYKDCKGYVISQDKLPTTTTVGSLENVEYN